MRSWFAQLELREKIILGVGLALAAIIMIGRFAWWPMHDGTVQLREEVRQKTRLLADLRRTQAVQAAPTGATGSGASQSLYTLVDSTASSLGLSFTRTAQDTTGGVDAIRVSFSNAVFDDLVEWLVMLERSYGVSVESFSVNGTRDLGLVSGQIFLRRQ